jgi:hypothetical protein
MNENWASVKGFEGVYEVSTHGRLRRLSQASARIKRIHPGRNYLPRLLTAVINNGYGYFTLVAHGKRIRRGIHALVLETFVGPRPQGLYACHRDGNKSNNSLENLKWATPTENQDDRVKHGRGQTGENNGSCKLTDSQVEEVRELRKTTGLAYNKIAKLFSCSTGNVHLICTNKTRKTNITL